MVILVILVNTDTVIFLYYHQIIQFDSNCDFCRAFHENKAILCSK